MRSRAPDPAASLPAMDAKGWDVTLARLTSQEPPERLAGAQALRLLCAIGPDAPFDRILAAVKARLAFGPGREPDRKVASALFEASKLVGHLRARRDGVRVLRPADLPTLEAGRLTWVVLERLWDAASIYDGRAKLVETLKLASPGQVALYAVWWTQSEVRNGGMRQYFHNDTGVLAPEAIEGFRRIGEVEVSEALRRAVEAFPGGYSPDTRERQARLQDEEPEAFEAASQAIFAAAGLFERAAAYVRAHPSEFFLDG